MECVPTAISLVPSNSYAYKTIQDLRNSRRRNKHSQSLQVLNKLVTTHLGPYNFFSDLSLLNHYQAVLSSLFSRLNKNNINKPSSQITFQTTTEPIQQIAQQNDFIELVFMIFNFKYFYLKIYLTKLTSQEQKNNVHSKQQQDWDNLESLQYFPTSPLLQNIFLGLIRHKNFNEQLINHTEYKNLDVNEYVNTLIYKKQYNMANKYFKQYILDQQEQNLRMSKKQLKKELDQFVKNFLDCMIQNGINCKKNKNYKLAYQYFHRAFTCCQQFEKHMNLNLIHYFIKTRIVYAVFHIECKKYNTAKIILLQTLKLQQFEIQLLDNDIKNIHKIESKLFDKKIKIIISTLINLMICYKNLELFNQIQEVSQLINLLQNLFSIKDEFTIMLDKQFFFCPDTQSLNQIILSLTEIQQTIKEYLVKDVYINDLYKKVIDRKIIDDNKENFQFIKNNQFKQSVFKNISSKLIIKRKQDVIQNDSLKFTIDNQKNRGSFQQSLGQQSLNKILKKPLSSHQVSQLATEQQSTQASKIKSQLRKQRNFSDYQFQNVNRNLHSDLNGENISNESQQEYKDQMIETLPTKINNSDPQNRMVNESFEMPETLNHKSSLLMIKDNNSLVKCAFQKSVHQLNRREFQLDIQEGFRPQLVQEQELFDEFIDREEIIDEPRKNYNDIHLTYRQVEIMLKQNGDQPISKDIDYYMKDRISQQEKQLIYQSLHQFEQKCTDLKYLQNDQGKAFNFYKKILRFKSREALKNTQKTVYGVPGKPHKVVIDKKQIKQFKDFKLNIQMNNAKNKKLKNKQRSVDQKNQLNQISSKIIMEMNSKFKENSPNEEKKNKENNGILKLTDFVKQQHNQANSINHKNLDEIEKKIEQSRFNKEKKEYKKFRLFEQYNELAILNNNQ